MNDPMVDIMYKKWFIMFPKDAYALGPIYFETPVGESEVREYARKFEGVRKLPAGFECWPTS